MNSSNLPIILASSSAYRRALLSRVVDQFDSQSPSIDESALENESAIELAARLARAKAKKVAEQNPRHWVIGSDQVACVEGRLLGKPGNFDTACEQLEYSSARCVTFHTAVTLIPPTNTQATDPAIKVAVDTTRVQFRALSRDEVEYYLKREQPYDCAGSFKCEGLGTLLFESIEQTDPSALIGLPLIALNRLFLDAGVNLLLLKRQTSA